MEAIPIIGEKPQEEAQGQKLRESRDPDLEAKILDILQGKENAPTEMTAHLAKQILKAREQVKTYQQQMDVLRSKAEQGVGAMVAYTEDLHQLMQEYRDAGGAKVPQN